MSDRDERAGHWVVTDDDGMKILEMVDGPFSVVVEFDASMEPVQELADGLFHFDSCPLIVWRKLLARLQPAAGPPDKA